MAEIDTERKRQEKTPLKERMAKTFSAMKHRNYRLWFWGQMVSMFGTWMQGAAQAFLIYELTHSPTYLGLVGFVAGIPYWLFSLYGGVITDRVSRRKLLIFTQVGMMVLAMLLAGLTFSGWVRPWHILVLAFLNGVANAFDAPARHAFMPDMVPKDDLANAIVMNGTMYNTSTILGPALGGVLYALVGPGWCFTINGLSFLAIIIGLLMMRLPKIEISKKREPIITELKEGVSYVMRQPVLRGTVLVMVISGLFGLSFMTLMPAWSVEVLGGDATTNGLMQAARGLGALIIALWIASLGNFRFKGRLVTIGTLVVPVLTIVFSFIRAVPAAFAMLVAIGMANLLIANLSTVLTQMNTEDRLRGRVMGLYTFVFFGFMPLGSLWIGAAAEWLGAPMAIVICGVMTLFCSLALLRFVPQLSRAE